MINLSDYKPIDNQDYHLVDNPIYFGTDEADGPLFRATTVAFGSI